MMRAAVVYESMYGNTRLIADAIADGLVGTCEVAVMRVGDARPELLDGVDLLVVGGPTHAWSMSRHNTRREAVQAAQKRNSNLHLEPDVEEPGVREWLPTLQRHAGLATAAFDTRMPGPAILTGRACTAIARQLRRHEYQLVAKPESFRVSSCCPASRRARGHGASGSRLPPALPDLTSRGNDQNRAVRYVQQPDRNAAQ